MIVLQTFTASDFYWDAGTERKSFFVFFELEDGSKIQEGLPEDLKAAETDSSVVERVIEWALYKAFGVDIFERSSESDDA